MSVRKVREVRDVRAVRDVRVRGIKEVLRAGQSEPTGMLQEVVEELEFKSLPPDVLTLIAAAMVGDCTKVRELCDQLHWMEFRVCNKPDFWEAAYRMLLNLPMTADRPATLRPHEAQNWHLYDRSKILNTWQHAFERECALVHTNETLRKAMLECVQAKNWVHEKYGPVEEWRVQRVTDMSRLIFSNLDLTLWDTSNVTNMSNMFFNQRVAARGIENWDVSKVTNMEQMFWGCAAFNADLSEWVVSNVTDMGGMFYGCAAFNGDLSKWNVSNVTSTSGMFGDCVAFEGRGLSEWNVSKVQYMSNMFFGCSVFNPHLLRWNVSKVTNMTNMFRDCSMFNADLSEWNVSKVYDMDDMFNGCVVFQGKGLSEWAFGFLPSRRMRWMFYNCAAFNADLSKWKPSNDMTLSGMFYNCAAFAPEHHPAFQSEATDRPPRRLAFT